MKGKFKLCIGLLTLSIICLLSLNLSSDVNAANVSNFSVNIATGGDYHWISGKTWGSSFDANYIRRIEPHFTFNGTPSGNYGSLSSTFNLVNVSCGYNSPNARLINQNTIVLEQLVVNNGMATIEEKSVRVSTTDWTTSQVINNINYTCYNRTFTFYVSATFTNFNSGSNPSIWFTIGSNTAFIFDNQYQSALDYFYFEDDSNNQTNVSFDNNVSNSLLQTQVNQNQTIINQNNQTNQYLSEQAEKDQQDRDNLDQASDDADSSSNLSQQQAEQTGTTLLKAFTDFVGALTNARPSNCNLNMDLGNLDMGVVNLCSLSPPPVFQTIASIFMILFCVPLSIATARKVISLFRSFQ